MALRKAVPLSTALLGRAVSSPQESSSPLFDQEIASLIEDKTVFVFFFFKPFHCSLIPELYVQYF